MRTFVNGARLCVNPNAKYLTNTVENVLHNIEKSDRSSLAWQTCQTNLRCLINGNINSHLDVPLTRRTSSILKVARSRRGIKKNVLEESERKKSLFYQLLKASQDVGGDNRMRSIIKPSCKTREEEFRGKEQIELKDDGMFNEISDIVKVYLSEPTNVHENPFLLIHPKLKTKTVKCSKTSSNKAENWLYPKILEMYKVTQNKKTSKSSKSSKKRRKPKKRSTKKSTAATEKNQTKKSLQAENTTEQQEPQKHKGKVKRGKSFKSAVRSGQPDFKVNQSVIRSGKPDFKVNQSAILSGKPDFKVNQSAIRSGKPDFKVNQSDIRSGKPDFKVNQSAKGSGELDLEVNESVVQSGEPDLNMNQSTASIQPTVQPTDDSNQPTNQETIVTAVNEHKHKHKHKHKKLHIYPSVPPETRRPSQETLSSIPEAAQEDSADTLNLKTFLKAPKSPKSPRISSESLASLPEDQIVASAEAHLSLPNEEAKEYHEKQGTNTVPFHHQRPRQQRKSSKISHTSTLDANQNLFEPKLLKQVSQESLNSSQSPPPRSLGSSREFQAANDGSQSVQFSQASYSHKFQKKKLHSIPNRSLASSNQRKNAKKDRLPGIPPTSAVRPPSQRKNKRFKRQRDLFKLKRKIFSLLPNDAFVHQKRKELMKSEETNPDIIETYEQRLTKLQHYLSCTTSFHDLDEINIDGINIEELLFYPYPYPEIPTPKTQEQKPVPKLRKKKSVKAKPSKLLNEPLKCQCCICQELHRNSGRKDAPFIVEMKKELRRQELKAYLCQRQNIGEENKIRDIEDDEIIRQTVTICHGKPYCKTVRYMTEKPILLME